MISLEVSSVDFRASLFVSRISCQYAMTDMCLLYRRPGFLGAKKSLLAGTIC
jgi:hypothetical protein